MLGLCLLLAIFVFVPYSLWWLHESGDAALERAVAAQARGDFALFGSGLSQDFVDYKLQLYAATRPEVIAIGSSRVMQFRGAWFSRPFLNMGGVAGNLAVLRSTLEALLAISTPRVVILGIDFWWFMPQWEKEPEIDVPPTSGSYNYSLASLKKPWEWFLDGKISLRELGAPVFGLFGAGFRADRFGIMAQQTNDGFGPDGSWYYTAEITGAKPALDWRFEDTLQNIKYGIRAFYHANPGQTGPDERHIKTMQGIWRLLKDRGIKAYAFIPPLAPAVLERMPRRQYPHLYKLSQALAGAGIDALDFSDAQAAGSGNCEFVDGFHGGEVTYGRILRCLALRWPELARYVNMAALDALIERWAGNALVPDIRLTDRPETDFLGLNCIKNNI